LKVGADGSLELAGFTAHGISTPKALEVLERGMGHAARAVHVGVRNAGSLLRGENVFVR
jgi:hypothetical protein